MIRKKLLEFPKELRLAANVVLLLQLQRTPSTPYLQLWAILAFRLSVLSFPDINGERMVPYFDPVIFQNVTFASRSFKHNKQTHKAQTGCNARFVFLEVVERLLNSFISKSHARFLHSKVRGGEVGWQRRA
jgi:hypothetical protein